MDVQLLEEVHDKGVDLRQQTHEEDDGEAQREDCEGDEDISYIETQLIS